MLTNQEIKISKTLSYALRHKPEEFNLVLDDQGYTELSEVIRKMAESGFPGLTKEKLQAILNRSDKTRWEIKDEKIRAVYGHSTKKKIEKLPVIPPQYLYHGTAHRFLENILREGLIPKGRQYVHLSQEVETAVIVGKRRDQSPIILRVAALEASGNGLRFYQELEGIWLSDVIPPKYLEIEQ
ncbi:RNA 2'-phosphotransferase [Enterococcus sp. BWB1-3]|uniref:RNA 2'-phosphotransferase n=1 Tax=unclassified Enterococcus TaxID=2608891 RepID=UPI0019248264|nr:MULTISPECIES: RNA 2'-phosphotransferase [unclassified Enterococcus]MBL1229013.1 RNA 2'-phosphotransferase [Enterococcus sp. BWB1-3]MCB5952282.1 RNA 2'-phosphotransferase [Enterococcus sp. BWT-B8]MCB5955489.1 RNA 2'-phosphotransferase [Enterococcus sp. CWB-B31]